MRLSVSNVPHSYNNLPASRQTQSILKFLLCWQYQYQSTKLCQLLYPNHLLVEKVFAAVRLLLLRNAKAQAS